MLGRFDDTGAGEESNAIPGRGRKKRCWVLWLQQLKVPERAQPQGLRERSWLMFGLSWKIQFLLGRHPAMTHPFIHHHLSPDISIHHHPSLCRKGWVKMGWTNEFQLMSSEENNHGTISDTCGYITCLQMQMIGVGKYNFFLGEIRRCSIPLSIRSPSITKYFFPSPFITL